jgi:predicted nucleotidyltransferase
MPWTSKHVQWLIDTKKRLITADGKSVAIFEFQHKNDVKVLSVWAKHFRNHYCLDSEIDSLVSGTGLTKGQYLEQVKFPDKTNAPGPSIRAGDFAEILVADYLEYVLKKYWVPRNRFNNKAVRNESVKGCDVLGFYVKNDGKISADDELILFESKAQLTSVATMTSRLQDAITDSAKDIVRKAEALNALKQRFLDRAQKSEAQTVERFQNITDNPYKEVNGAAAVLCKDAFNESVASNANSEKHPNSRNLVLVIIHGADLMALAHDLYRRAADEA